MNGHDFLTLSRSWGCLTETLPEEVESITCMDEVLMGEALIRLLAKSLGFSLEQRDMATRFSLELPKGLEDPLDGRTSSVFTKLLGATAGQRSSNGYLDASEALGRALMRLRTCESVELKSAILSAWGEHAVFILLARDLETGEEVPFSFTHRSMPVPREGLVRSSEMPLSALRGFGYMLEGGNILNPPSSSSSAHPPIRKPKPGTGKKSVTS
jgi:hypothetical protein